MELYVHFPFCKQKCRYCDFPSFAGLEDRMEAYVSALLEEAGLRADEISCPVETVYFGGGTPSLLPAPLLEKCIKGLKQLLPLDHVLEWTVEANPGTLNGLWLETALEGGINRLSLGAQAFQPRLLNLLGRIHGPEEIQQGVRLARNAGFQNVSLDLIFGLPTQTRAEWQNTLDSTLSLSPQHISAYGLIPEEGTPLRKDLDDGIIRLPKDETERDMYGDLLEILSAAGYAQYEISNFARPGFACRHNIGYWRQTPYVGLGLSAASMGIPQRQDGLILGYLRCTNTADLAEYLQGAATGHPVLAEKEWVDGKEAMFETMMLGLRMNEGVSDALFRSLHGRSMSDVPGLLDALQQQAARGLLVWEDECWKLTRAGMDLQNTVLVDLMDLFE